MKPGLLHAWLASVTEIVGGALLILGLLTPLGGAATIGVMAVAGITNHRGNGFFIFRPGEGWEYVLTLAIAGFAIAVIGPGEWSLDDAFDLTDDLVGMTGLLRSEEHTSELQSLMRISYAVFCLKKKKITELKTRQVQVWII